MRENYKILENNYPSIKKNLKKKKKNKQTASRNVDFRGIASKGSGQEECD